MLQRRSTKRSKPKNTRGRLALPGGDLRDLVPVGGSEFTLVAEFRAHTPEIGAKVKQR